MTPRKPLQAVGEVKPRSDEGEGAANSTVPLAAPSAPVLTHLDLSRSRERFGGRASKP
jgi:hypothetical protein